MAVPESVSVRMYVTFSVRVTVDPDFGVELFTTLSTTTGFVTLEEQASPVHVWPVTVVMEAVFVTDVLSVELTVTENVTVTECCGARDTVIWTVVPVAFAVQVSGGAVTWPQTGGLEVVAVTLLGRGSVTVAVPADAPVLVTLTVYVIVDPGVTATPVPGTSVFRTVNVAGPMMVTHSDATPSPEVLSLDDV